MAASEQVNSPATPVRSITATVCNFNGLEYLQDCLDALLAQTYPLSEIVVYDNASTDGSVAFLEMKFPKVRVVAMERNEGPCPVRNRGLREAQHALVLQVDSDIVLHPECVAQLVAEYERTHDPEQPVAIVMPRAVFHHEPNRVHYDGGWFHYVGVMVLPNFFQPKPEGPEPAHDVDASIAMALLLDRDLLCQVGAYDPEFFILFEDHDLSYRLRMRGARIRFVPSCLVFHKQGTAGISFREGTQYPKRRAYLHSRNRWMVLLRNYSWWTMFVLGPGILFYEFVWFGFALTKGNLLPYCHGKWDLLRSLPRLLKERRAIQGQRRLRDRRLLGAAPLTHAPMVKTSLWQKWAESAIEAVLKLWWALSAWALPK